MQYQIKSDDSSIDLIGQFYRLHFSLTDNKTEGLEVFHREGKDELLMGKIRYFGKIILKTETSSPLPTSGLDSLEGKSFDMIPSRAKVITSSKDSPYVTLEMVSPGKAKAYIQVFPIDGKSIDINVGVTVLNPQSRQMGFALFCLDCVTKSERVRLMPGLYSGWNEAGRSIVIYPRFFSTLCKQFTLIKHYTRKEKLSILSKDQGIIFTYPEGMLAAVTELDFGTEITGSWRVELGKDDVWDPALAEKAEKYAAHDPGIQCPRYNYDRFLQNWQVFMKRPELFVELGKGIGFFHRGYHKVCRGRMLPCGAHPHKGFIRDTGAKSRKSRLCELAWGGSANSLLAYTLFTLGEDWAKEKATAVTRAVVEFKNGAYQVKEGPIKGAWWNGYLVDEDRFCDRFGSENLYTPNGGITNYFLGKILLEGYRKDKTLVEMIENNCKYLKRIEFKTGGVPFGLKLDGSPASDRHAIVYEGDYAIPAAFAAISHLVCYQLTGKKVYKEDAARLLNHLFKHIKKNNWRYHGYDTYGTNSQSLGWILTILSEFVIAGFKEAKEPAEKTLRALISFQHTFDMGIDRHSNLESIWGGRMKNRGTFPTGSSRHFMQDYNTGHNRFDPAHGLLVCYRALKDARAYTSLVNFLNNLTHHQFTNPDIPIGFGAVCERISFVDGEFNDQVQTLHSNPLQHILLNQDLFLMGTGADVTRVSTGPGKLEFTLTSPVPVKTWFMVGGNKDKAVCVTSDNKKVYTGPAGYVPCDVNGETAFKVTTV
jgi:hypothetical protein